MLHTFLHPPFPDPVRQAQFEALQATLAAEPGAPAVSLLLGNFAVQEGGEVFDAVLVRPHSVSVLLFVPGGGHLDIPTTGASWQLAGRPLFPNSGTLNPFGQFRRLKSELAEWLAAQLGPDQVAPELITGLALFTEPVTFGPGVEQYLRTQPGADSFQLLGDLRQLPKRLDQLAHPDIQLSDAELRSWAQDLAAEHPEENAELPVSEEAGQETSMPGYWEGKARQLWRWLGAEDVPHDAPYGTAAVAASTEEKQQLEQLRQQMRTELTQQRQEMEAREAEREKSIALLRAQLAQAPAAAADAAALQARLATETREKAALEEAIRASRADAAVRNQELDARIQQLGQLIAQFQAKPQGAAGSSTPAPKPAAAAGGSKNLVRRPTTHLNWPRVAFVVAAALGLGLGAWGLVRLQDNPPQEPARHAADHPQPDDDTATDQASAAPDDQEQEPTTELDTATTEAQPVTETDIPLQSEEAAPPADTPHDTVYTAPEGPVETDSAATPNE